MLSKLKFITFIACSCVYWHILSYSLDFMYFSISCNWNRQLVHFLFSHVIQKRQLLSHCMSYERIILLRLLTRHLHRLIQSSISIHSRLNFCQKCTSQQSKIIVFHSNSWFPTREVRSMNKVQHEKSLCYLQTVSSIRYHSKEPVAKLRRIDERKLQLSHTYIYISNTHG